MITLNNPLALESFLVWLIGLVVICYGLSKSFSWTLVLALGVTGFSSLRIFQNSLNGLPNDPMVRQFTLAAESALISLLLTVMICQGLQIRTWVNVFKGIAFINGIAICCDSFYFLVTGLINQLPWSTLASHEPWGILLNASMSGCLNAAIFPLIDPREKWLRAFVVLSVFATGRSMPIAVFFVGCAAWLFLQKRFAKISLVLVASLAVGIFLKGSLFFESRGRANVWWQAYSFFHDHLPWSVGSGLGGFYVIGPALTIKSSIVFVWLHSDWLQTFFEQGIVGFAVVATLYAHALWRARKTPQLFGALAAFAAFGAANMPLRYPISGLFGAVLIRWAMEKKPVGPASEISDRA